MLIEIYEEQEFSNKAVKGDETRNVLNIFLFALGFLTDKSLR